MIPGQQLYRRTIDKLSRVTTSGRYIPELDGLRFIAIGSVFVQHVQQIVMSRLGSDALGTNLKVDLAARVIRDSRFGVELFFIISGFILGLPFADHHLTGGRAVNLRAYFTRRLTRLEPPYLLSLAICTWLLVALQGISIRTLLPHLIASSFYFHNIVFNAFSTVNPVAWSLEIEVQFYCLAPVLAGLFRIRRVVLRRFCIVALGFAALAAHMLAHRYWDIPHTLLFYLQYFMMGFLIADVFLLEWNQAPRHSLAWDLVAIPGWLLILPASFLGSFGGSSAVTAIVLVILVYATFRSEITRATLASPIIRTTGGMCYTIYLLHYVLAWSIAPALHPSGGMPIIVETARYSLLIAIALIPVVIVYFLAIEKPCMQKDWPARLKTLAMRKLADLGTHWRGGRSAVPETDGNSGAEHQAPR